MGQYRNMHKIIYLLTGIILGFIVSFGSQSIFDYRLQNSEKVQTQIPSPSPTSQQLAELEQRKYTINIPAKYFETRFDDDSAGLIKLNNVFSSDIPEAIPLDPNIQPLNEDIPSFNCGKKETADYTEGFCPRLKYTDEFDVDSDGQKEKILRIHMGVNHGVEDLFIVKNNKVIFKIQDRPVSIEKSKNGNGFYLNYDFTSFLGQLGSEYTVRYIHDNGKFIPVWHQTHHEVGTSEP